MAATTKNKRNFQNAPPCIQVPFIDLGRCVCFFAHVFHLLVSTPSSGKPRDTLGAEGIYKSPLKHLPTEQLQLSQASLSVLDEALVAFGALVLKIKSKKGLADT